MKDVTTSLLFAAVQASIYSSLVVFLLRSQMDSDIAAAVLLAALIIGVGIMVVNSFKAQKQM